MPLSDWFAESVRAALIRELGRLPAEEPEPETAEPEPEAAEPEPEAPETGSAVSSAERDEPPAPAPEAPPAKPIPSVTEYRARRISLEAQRLAAGGLSGWLATRIEGLPAGGLPAAPSAPKGVPPAPSSPHVPPKPQLDLFHAVPPKAAPVSAAAPPVAPLAPSKAPELPAVLPLSLPSGPVVRLALSALRPPRIRARRSSGVDPGIAALAASVAAQGVREPILVRRLAEDAGSYEVVAGERRRLAAERAGRADLPAVIVEADDAEALTLSLAENLGRGDFSPLNEGRCYLRLLTEYRISPSVLAPRLARERSHIALALRLLGLPEKVRRLIDDGQLAPAHAYALLSAPDPEALARQMVQADAPVAGGDSP
jgi:ParB/RepB/Spo0J family partition protein